MPPRRKTTVLLAAALALLAAGPAGVAHVRFLDRRATVETEESTTLYLDQKLVGSFRLDAATEEQMLGVDVPEAPVHTYRLCGRVIARTDDGREESHEVNSAGTITGEVNGRVFEALTSDFSTFFLADVTPLRPPLPIETVQGTGCAAAISMR